MMSFYVHQILQCLCEESQTAKMFLQFVS